MKHRSIAIVLGTLLLAVLLVVGAATLLPNNSHAHAGTNSAVAPHPPTTTKGTIAPPSKMGAGFIDPPATGKTLTDGQITAYLETHPFMAGDTTTGANPKVVKIEHMTPADFKKRRGVTIQLPTAEQLVLVTVSGPFHLNRMSAPSKAKPTLAKQTVNQGYLLIDIQTGNLQAWML